MKPFADHFSAIAGTYSVARPTYPPALFEWLASTAPGRARAWDCAAGNGQAARGLASCFAAVIATDASAAQIARSPSNARVSRCVDLAEASGLRDGSVQLVAVAQALHWLDLDAFYREARRVLVPRGVLAVWCYGLVHLNDPAIDTLLQHLYRSVLGPYWAPERRLVDTGYRTLAFPFDEVAAPAFDMGADWSRAELVAYLGTWSAVLRFRRERGYDPVEPFAARLATLWGVGNARRWVRWPLSLRVGRAGAAA